MTTYLVNKTHRVDRFEQQTPGLQLLTPQERAILRLIARDKTSKDIADAMGIARKTVDAHRSSICRKLDSTASTCWRGSPRAIERTCNSCFPVIASSKRVKGGRIGSACSQLSDFQAEVTRKVLDNALTAGEAVALIEAATSIRTALGC